MKIFNILSFCFLLFPVFITNAQVSSKTDLIIGDKHLLRSNILGEDRVLNVYLPDDYNDTTSYDIVYLLDGSMTEDFMHIAGLTQFVNMMYTMPKCIVVGIANVDRQRDFTFEPSLEEYKKAIPNGGHSAKFISFLEEELIPFIDGKYTVGDKRYLIGQSLGGLLATEVLINKPALFTHYFIVSPSLWWNKESLLENAKTTLPQQNDSLNIYVDIYVGKKEPFIMRRDARRLKKILKRKTKHEIKFTLMRKEDHATILHNSIYRAFVKLFEPRY